MRVNLRNKQDAFTYAIYMMASSYFSQAKCISHIQEMQLRLCYSEEPYKSQYEMEDFVIAYMDDLQEKLPKEIFQEEVKVNIVKYSESSLREINLRGNHFILRLIGLYQRGQMQMQWELWTK